MKGKKNKGELNVERFILRVKKKARKEELGARAMGYERHRVENTANR